MEISEYGKSFIKQFEGCRLRAYKVHGGEKYYTIGYGHYGADVTRDMVITEQQANELFDKDIQKYVNAVNNFIDETYNQNQFDALVSFCYNLGVNILSDFRGMTKNEIAKEIPLYCHSGGVKLQGLVNRRKKEVDLFNTPVIKHDNVTSGYYLEKGKATVITDILNIRNSPSLSSGVIDTYKRGEVFFYDRVYKSEGYYWVSYISYSGVRRYVASRTIGSKEIYLRCE